ncbi:MAG TPA: Rieske 2Fe-2S domain-containing protein [Polyangia bacterium]|nr:Rieske 2Fe-2S domain-containing protein [Polyangia bacterium]
MAAHTFSGYPRGWFAVCFSDELAVGKSLPLRYFGQDLVAFRGEDGVAHVLEAYCAHMGAHLGVGGKVEGCTLRCPFHGWRYDGAGACVEIPYAKKIPPKAKQQSWRVHEINGHVLVHHDAEGQPPAYEIPVIPEYGSEAWLPWTTSRYRIKTHPREIVDNLADKAHFAFVHNTAIDDFGFDVAGHTATQHVKGRAFLADGKVDPFASTTTYHGPGYLLMRMDGLLKNYMLFTHTPIDENTLDLRLAVTLKVVGDRKRTEGYVAGYLDNLRRGFEDDIKIWEAKIYRDPAVLCDGDGPVGALRKWYRQFYTPAAKAADGAAATSAASAE